MNVTEVEQICDVLAKKLGPTASTIMETTENLGIMSVYQSLASLALIIASFGVWRRVQRLCKDGDIEETAALFITLTTKIVGAVSTFVFLAYSGDAILWLYSPKTWAIKYLLNLVK